MRKLYLLCAMFVAGFHLSAQEKESQQTLFERILRDEKMLNIMLDTRIDFQSDYTNGKIEDAFFHGQTIKVLFTGEIIPGIRYRVRQRLNKPQTPLREGYSSATDHAWLAFDIGKRWTITAGKQTVQLGTYEYDYNPADVYLTSMIYNDFDGYKAGVNAKYSFMKQALNLQVVNSSSPQFADPKYENRSIAILGLWEGSLFDDVLNTTPAGGMELFNTRRASFTNGLRWAHSLTSENSPAKWIITSATVTLITERM